MHLGLLSFLLTFSLMSSYVQLEISAPGFPAMRSELGMSEAVLGLSISYNLMASCLAGLIYGPLSDTYGRRRLMLLGNALMALGAFGCVFSNTAEALLGARFVQGLGAAAASVLVTAIAADAFDLKYATRFYSIMAAVICVFMGGAAIVGGLVVDSFGWRTNYAIIAVLSLIAWLLLVCFLKETKVSTQPLDYRRILGEYRQLCTSRTFMTIVIVPSLLYGHYLGFITIAPFVYMEIFGLGMREYTLHQTVVILSYAIFSVFGFRWVSWFAVRTVLIGALGVFVLGALWALGANSATAFTAAVSLSCVGSAILEPVIFPYTFYCFPELKGSASSMVVALRSLICAGSTTAVVFIYSGTALSLAYGLLAIVLLTALLTWQLLPVLGEGAVRQHG